MVLAASLLALAAAVPVAAGARAPRAARTPKTEPVPAGFVGMNVDQPTWPDEFVNLSQQLGVMVASGVENLRVVFDWSQLQPYHSWSEVPPDDRSQFVNVGGIPTDFTQTDQIMEQASERGMTLTPIILNAPAWDGQSYKGGIVDLPRTDGPFAAFVRALVQRYGPHGTFWFSYQGQLKEPITMWEVWNEPNIPAFWPQQPFVTRYLALLRAAHGAIKGVDPTAKVILAGLPNYSWLDLARIYKVRGASKLFDVVAVHPYTKYPKGVITILGYVRQVMDRNGDASKPILANELSWPSSLGKTNHDVGYDFATTEAGQAKNIGQLLPMLVRDRFRLNLLGFDYYDWAGLERENALTFDFAGLFRFNDGSFTAKPAYGVFQKAALAMEGCRSKTVATHCS